MDRDLPALPSAIFVLSLIAAIVLYMHYADQVSRPVFSQIFVDDRNNVFVVYQNFVVPVASNEFESVSLAQHRIRNHVGQMIPLKTGELIINHGGQNNSVLHKLKRFYRVTEGEPGSRQSTLLKCNGGLDVCESWGDQRLSFDTAWSGLELDDGYVIVNDTARHRVVLVDGMGQVQASLDGFRFPNHAEQAKGLVWIVDTNRNQLVGLKRSENDLVRSGQTVEFNDMPGISAEHKFPSVAQRSGANWIILSHDRGMANAGVYRVEGQSATRLLDNLNDVTAFLALDNSLFAADYASDSLWRLDLLTGDRQQLEPPALSSARRSVAENIDASKTEFYRYLALVLGVGLIGLVVAIKKSKPSEQGSALFLSRAHRIAVPPQPGLEPKPLTADGEIQWVSKHNRWLKQFDKVKSYAILILVPLVICVVAVNWMALSKSGWSAELFHLNLLILLAVSIVASGFLFLSMRIQLLLNQQLGSDGKNIIVKDNRTGAQSVIDPTSVIYSNCDLLADGVYVVWQNQKMVFYDKQEFEAIISPLLVDATKLNLLQLYFARLAAKEKLAIWETAFTLAALVLTLPLLIWLRASGY